MWFLLHYTTPHTEQASQDIYQLLKKKQKCCTKTTYHCHSINSSNSIHSIIHPGYRCMVPGKICYWILHSYVVTLLDGKISYSSINRGKWQFNKMLSLKWYMTSRIKTYFNLTTRTISCMSVPPSLTSSKFHWLDLPEQINFDGIHRD